MNVLDLIIFSNWLLYLSSLNNYLFKKYTYIEALKLLRPKVVISKENI